MNRLVWLPAVLLGVAMAACGSVDTLDPMGAGGQSGSAGAGGQSGGQGGGGGGKSCDQLRQDYATAMESARMCNAAIDIPQCEHIVSSQIVCGCPTSVNDRTELDRIEAAWMAAGCAPPVFCPAIACLAVARGQCVAISSGDVCSDVAQTTTN
jgi:hypothetical protein